MDTILYQSIKRDYNDLINYMLLKFDNSDMNITKIIIYYIYQIERGNLHNIKDRYYDHYWDKNKNIKNAYLLDKHIWWTISTYESLTEIFLEEFIDNVKWVQVSMYQNLSVDFIIKHYDRIDWNNIMKYREINEKFIFKLYEHNLEKHINWNKISENYNLKKDFIMKFYSKLNMNTIFLFRKDYKDISNLLEYIPYDIKSYD